MRMSSPCKLRTDPMQLESETAAFQDVSCCLHKKNRICHPGQHPVQSEVSPSRAVALGPHQNTTAKTDKDG